MFLLFVLHVVFKIFVDCDDNKLASESCVMLPTDGNDDPNGRASMKT